MKKIISLVLAGSLIFSLCATVTGCHSNECTSVRTLAGYRNDVDTVVLSDGNVYACDRVKDLDYSHNYSITLNTNNTTDPTDDYIIGITPIH